MASIRSARTLETNISLCFRHHKVQSPVLPPASAAITAHVKALGLRAFASRVISSSSSPVTTTGYRRPSCSSSINSWNRHQSSATSSSKPTSTSTPSSSSSSTHSQASCPSCQTSLSQHFTPICPQCSTILPPPPPPPPPAARSINASSSTASSNSFALFNLSPSFSIDVKDLKRVFLSYQQKIHPDLFSGQGEKENWAKIWSGKVNDEYKRLLDRRSRGEYLLGLHGIEIGEGDAVTDPELLMAIMETREALEDAQSEEEVEQIRTENQDQIEETFQILSKAFDNASEPQLDDAKNAIIRLKYLENVENVCKEWSPGKRIEIQH